MLLDKLEKKLINEYGEPSPPKKPEEPEAPKEEEN
jgi:hypothetical protein